MIKHIKKNHIIYKIAFVFFMAVFLFFLIRFVKGADNDNTTVLMLHFDTDFEDSSSDQKNLDSSNAEISPDAKIGSGSAYFDGTTLVSYDYDYDFPSGDGDWTVDFWIKPVTEDSSVIVTGSNSVNFRFSLIFNGGNETTNANINWCPISFPQVPGVITNEWHHVAYVKASKKLMVFIDGILKQNTSLSSDWHCYQLPQNGSTKLYIGKGSTGGGFNGYLDEFRISDFAKWTSDFDLNGLDMDANNLHLAWTSVPFSISGHYNATIVEGLSPLESYGYYNNNEIRISSSDNVATHFNHFYYNSDDKSLTSTGGSSIASQRTYLSSTRVPSVNYDELVAYSYNNQGYYSLHFVSTGSYNMENFSSEQVEDIDIERGGAGPLFTYKKFAVGDSIFLLSGEYDTTDIDFGSEYEIPLTDGKNLRLLGLDNSIYSDKYFLLTYEVFDGFGNKALKARVITRHTVDRKIIENIGPEITIFNGACTVIGHDVESIHKSGEEIKVLFFYGNGNSQACAKVASVVDDQLSLKNEYCFDSEAISTVNIDATDDHEAIAVYAYSDHLKAVGMVVDKLDNSVYFTDEYENMSFAPSTEYTFDVEAIDKHKVFVIYRNNFNSIDGGVISLEGPYTEKTDASTTLMYRFDETDGNFLDTSGNGHYISAEQGDVKFDSDIKRYGAGSAYFDGSSYFNILPADKLPGGTRKWTIDFWMYPTNVSHNMILGRYPSNGNASLASFWLGFDGASTRGNVWTDEIESVQDDNCLLGLGSPCGLKQNDWNHISFSSDTETLNLSVNGRNNSNITGAIPDVSTLGMLVGHYWPSGGNSFEGYIDNLRISDYVRWEEDFYVPRDNIVSGFAWNSSTGWISFDCNDVPTTCFGGTNEHELCSVDGDCHQGSCKNTCEYFSDYGVDIDTTGRNSFWTWNYFNSPSYNLSGYAWSPVLGWISFVETSLPLADGDTDTNPDYDFNSNCKLQCDANTKCTACYNPDDNKIYGWAKILSLGDNGWIRLDDDDPGDGIDYGLEINTVSREIEGWAYSAESSGSGLGWISFNCSNESVCAGSDYKVKAALNQSPTVSFPTMEDPGYCSDDDPFCEAGCACADDSCVLNPQLRWIYDDAPENDAYEKYQIFFDTSNHDVAELDGIDDGSGNSLPLKTEIITGTALSFYPGSVNVHRTVNIEHNTSYYFWIKVWDDKGSNSGWVQFFDENDADEDGNDYTFTTYKNEFPDPYFTWSPLKPSKGTYTTFKDISTYHDTLPLDRNSTEWEFSNGTILSGPNAASTTYQVFTEDLFHATSTAIDENGYKCSTSTSQVPTNLKLPIWIEAR